MENNPHAGATQNLHLDKRAASLSDVVRAASAARGVTLVVAPEGLPTKNTADLMGVSEAFLAKQRRAGEGPAYIKLSPTLIRYRPEDILSWLESRRVTHEARPDKRKAERRSKSDRKVRGIISESVTDPARKADAK